MTPNSQQTVLLIEDDPSFIYLIQRYSEKSGWRMVCTSLGEEALAMVRTEMPTVVVLDIALPGINGWEVLRTLKGESDTRGVPVVMCSGVEEVKQSLEAGADAWLQKPIRYQEFVAVLTDVGMKPGL
jgi:DNA-binding response OmpR family regulator